MRERDVITIGVLALLVVGVVGYLKTKSLVTAAPAGTFNPLSTNNLAYTGANSVFSAVTGNTADSIGTALAGLFGANSAGNAAVAPTPLPGPLTITPTIPDIPTAFDAAINLVYPDPFGLGGFGV